jgi:hypothetical protein
MFRSLTCREIRHRYTNSKHLQHPMDRQQRKVAATVIEILMDGYKTK